MFQININDRFDNEVAYSTQNPPMRFFFYGQLYVVISRVILKNVLKILLTNLNEEDVKVTSNVVYK
jgi:hypothetical protein